MLHQLYRYANDHNLAIKYGFKSKVCKWAIDLDDDGDLLGVRLIDREFPLCPDLSQQEMISGGITKSHFLLDSRDVIESTSDPSPKHEYFVQLIIKAAQESDSRLSPCSEFLQDETKMQRLKEEMDAKKVKPADKLTFHVDGVYLVEQTSWHGWWQDFKRSLAKEGKSKGGEMLCLMEGVPTVPVASHGKINISRVGGISSGSVLVGFDKDAFGSFGLSASSNAAMSQDSVLTYTAAMNHMIQSAPKPLGNVLSLHGYDKPVPQDDDLFALLAGLSAGDDKEVMSDAERRLSELIEAVRHGKRSEYLGNSYYVFMVSGASGRVMIRDYFEGDCARLADSFNAWFEDLSLVAPNAGSSKAPKLSGLLSRLVSFRDGESGAKLFERVGDEVSSLIPIIWRSILTGSPLPDTIAAKSLNHMRSRLLRTQNAMPDALACMWLKIWLNRGGFTMTKGLNKDETSQAYHLGRLLAVYAKLQEDANPGVNVGVGQRYFASASTTPALVLGRLATLSNHHLAKLSEGRAVWYKQQLQEVSENIDSRLPDVMSLREQSLFALGYYHQMAEFYKKAPAQKEEE